MIRNNKPRGPDSRPSEILIGTRKASAGTAFDYLPNGPFDLATQNQFFGGWPNFKNDPGAIVMAFPVEGWKGSAAVALRQTADGKVKGHIYGPDSLVEKAQRQALACLSLDIPAENWPLVGKRDAVIGELQNKYGLVRPILFHSPYEAAAGFVIGHRITIKQKQAVMQRMSQELGEQIEIDGEVFHAFPDPHALLTLAANGRLSELKIERLHGVAKAALDGLLDRDSLRSLPIDRALVMLRSISGIGPFFAQGILYRGAGLVDEITSDDLTPYAVQVAYKLEKLPNHKQVLEIARLWKPFRMWATVLLHIWLRREVGLPKKRTFTAE